MNLITHSSIKPLIPFEQILQSGHTYYHNAFAYSLQNKQNYSTYTEQYPSAKQLIPFYTESGKFYSMLHFDWLFILGFVLLAWATYIKVQFPHALIQLLKSLFNYQHARQLINEKSNTVQKLSNYLMILFSFSFTLFLLAFVCFYFSSQIVTYKTFLMIYIFVILFFGMKYLLYLGIGFITDTMVQTKIVINHFNVFYRILAVILLPLSITLFYANYKLVSVLLIVGLCLIAGFYLMRLYRGFILCKQMRFSYLFIFIYLCTLEIIPLIYVLKTFVMWL